MSGLLRHAQKNSIGRLLDDEGRPNVSVIEKYVSVLTRMVFLAIFHKEVLC